MKLTPLHFGNDFCLVVYPTDAQGNRCGWPDHDWRIEVRSNPYMAPYVAQCIDGVTTNAEPTRSGDGIIVILDNHQLAPGKYLHVKYESDIPNDLYPDGKQHIVCVERVMRPLCDCSGQPPSAIEVNAILPFIRGERGADGVSPRITSQGTWERWDDLKAEWIDTGVKAGGVQSGEGTDPTEALTDEDLDEIIDEVSKTDH